MMASASVVDIGYVKDFSYSWYLRSVFSSDLSCTSFCQSIKPLALQASTRRFDLDPLDEFMSDTFTDDINPELREQLRQILSASTNLINIELGSNASIDKYTYSGIVAEFCHLNFTAQKEYPSGFTLFDDVVEVSNCGEDSNKIIRADLQQVVRLSRKFDLYIDADSTSSNIPALLDLKGVVFHESRCGARLAANSMMALDSIRHRVYSESRIPERAMRSCGEGYTDCSVNAAANLLKDVLYMMSRSNNPKEENLYFIFDPESTRTMETFRTAFPTTPWIFLYRDPVEAMVSQGENPAFSTWPSPMVRAFVKREGYRMEDLTTKEKYAIQLATFCLSALRNFNDADGLGLAVRYTSDLLDDFIDTIIPKHFHTSVGEDGKRQMFSIAEELHYSEDGLRPVPDNQKEIEASKLIRNVVKLFLRKSYKQLEDSEYNIENCRTFKPSGVSLRCREKYKDV